jgi:energy-coupling factor transporter ATP-binding protein EcfA2
MRLTKIRIRNYRCLRDVEFFLGDLTGLIGINGSGKSAVLRAIAAFYEQGDLPWPEDWYAGDTENELEVALTFGDLAPNERDRFPRHVTTEGELKVARIWRVEDDRVRDALHGYHFACPDFQPVRDAEKGVSQLHNNLVDTGRYEGLRKVARQDDVEGALQEWEATHPESCEWIRDNGKFFGWRQVGGAKLAASSSCVYVPAVRDARDDAAQTRGSALSQIVDLVLKTELQNNPDLVSLRTQTQDRFGEILQATRPTLQALAEELSSLMRQYAPGSGVVLDWRTDTPALPEWPPIEARLVEEGVESPVWAKGHGLQRSFIVSVLQRLAEARSQSPPVAAGGDSQHTIILIEEPELYQHPLAARQFARVLRRLTSSDNSVQAMYSTHHPEFVAFDHFDSIRLLQKKPRDSAEPPDTAVSSLSLDEVSKRLIELWELHPETVTDESTRQRLRTAMNPQVSEGFFARAVVLVEGEQDEAMLEGLANARGIDLGDKGIAILPVRGKGNLDRALMVFTGFEITTYVVWDGDESNQQQREVNVRQNRVLARLAGLEAADFPATTVSDRGTVFADKLEAELKAALGERFDELVLKTADAVGLPAGRDALKSSYGCTAFVQLLSDEGLNVPVLDQLIEKIGSMVP